VTPSKGVSVGSPNIVGTVRAFPSQQATQFEFIISLKAAKQIGLTIPVRVLERANQVIK
jgi:ABC-type uncharacterized transport system substrate-binding protein